MHIVKEQEGGEWVHGIHTGAGRERDGSAWSNGLLIVREGFDKGFQRYRCRSYRQAVRQLRRWLRGQGVTAVRVS